MCPLWRWRKARMKPIWREYLTLWLGWESTQTLDKFIQSVHQVAEGSAEDWATYRTDQRFDLQLKGVGHRFDCNNPNPVLEYKGQFKPLYSHDATTGLLFNMEYFYIIGEIFPYRVSGRQQYYLFIIHFSPEESIVNDSMFTKFITPTKDKRSTNKNQEMIESGDLRDVFVMHSFCFSDCIYRRCALSVCKQDNRLQSLLSEVKQKNVCNNAKYWYLHGSLVPVCP